LILHLLLDKRFALFAGSGFSEPTRYFRQKRKVGTIWQFCAEREVSVESKAGSWKKEEITNEVVGIRVLLTHSLFVSDILHRLLRRVSLAKPISAPLRL
jgi:hypothetical protein